METKASGYKWYGEDCGEAWWLLGPTADDSDAEILEALDLAPYDVYGGPGRAFSRRPYIRRTRTRTLVTMQTGLDV